MPGNPRSARVGCNGTVLMNMSGFWQRVNVGGVVLVAVLVDLLRRRD